MRASKQDSPAAAVGVVINDGHILMVKLPLWYARQPAMWAMPGGLVEPGEDPGRAAEREVYEETAIEVKTKKLLHIDTSAGLPVHYYECRYIAGQPIHQAEETDDAQWQLLQKIHLLDLAYDPIVKLQSWNLL